MSAVVGRFSDAPYAMQRVWSTLAGGDAKVGLEAARVWRTGVAATIGFWDEGGGVMSDDGGGGGGETKVALVLFAATGPSTCIGRGSGDADMDAFDKIGVVGMVISAGAPRDVCEDVSSRTLGGLRFMAAHPRRTTERTGVEAAQAIGRQWDQMRTELFLPKGHDAAIAQRLYPMMCGPG